MRLALLVILATFVMFRAAPACLNEYTPNEIAIMQDQTSLQRITDHSLEIPWAEDRERLRAKADATPTIENLNDYAVALCHTGDPDAAIEVLKRIEKMHPNAYQTATNLGTAYELAGQNEEALRWIEEGIHRNPRSHEGSEWIHVAILKAKLALAEDPHWLESHDVLGLDFGAANEPTAPQKLPRGNNGKRLSLGAIRDGLEHQLHERIQFVPGKDPLVSQLIFDFANLAELTLSPNAAMPLYDLSAKYGGFEPAVGGQAILQRRIGSYVSRILDYRPFYRRHKQVTRSLLIYGGAALLVFAGTVFLSSLADRVMGKRTPFWIVWLAEYGHKLRPHARLLLLIPLLIGASFTDSGLHYFLLIIVGIALIIATYFIQSSTGTTESARSPSAKNR